MVKGVKKSGTGKKGNKPSKAKYVDGYLLAVPKKNLAKYRRMANMGGKVWMKHGALDYKECVGDDLGDKGLGSATFPQTIALKPGETVVFSYITYKNRKHRDNVNAKVMKEFTESGEMDKTMPFDMKRMAYGGFEVIAG